MGKKSTLLSATTTKLASSEHFSPTFSDKNLDTLALPIDRVNSIHRITTYKLSPMPMASDAMRTLCSPSGSLNLFACSSRIAVEEENQNLVPDLEQQFILKDSEESMSRQGGKRKGIDHSWDKAVKISSAKEVSYWYTRFRQTYNKN